MFLVRGASPFAAFLAIATLSACAEDAAPEPPVSPAAAVRVFPAKATLASGQSLQLEAQAEDATGRPIGGAPLAFEATNAALVTVSAFGRIQSRGPVGTSAVLVSSGSQRKTVLVTVVAGVAAQIDAEAGDDQLGTVGQRLADPVTVKITDGNGNPVAGSSVTFTAQGGGSALSSVVVADALGHASTVWDLGPRAGVQTLVATSAGLAGSPVAFRATARATAAHSLSVSKSPPATAAAGSIVQAEVRALDRHSNPVPGVEVLWSPGGCVATVAPERALTDAEGRVSAKWSLDRSLASCALEARAAPVRGRPLEFSVRTVAGPAARIEIVGGAGQRAPVGEALPEPVVARVVDALGNGVPGASLSVRYAPGAAAATDVLTDKNGEVKLPTWTLAAAGRNEAFLSLAADISASVLAGGHSRLRILDGPRGEETVAFTVANPLPSFDGAIEGHLAALRKEGSRRALGTACDRLPGVRAGALLLARAGGCAIEIKLRHAAEAGAKALLVVGQERIEREEPAAVNGAEPAITWGSVPARLAGLTRWLEKHDTRARIEAPARRETEKRATPSTRSDGGAAAGPGGLR